MFCVLRRSIKVTLHRGFEIGLTDMQWVNASAKRGSRGECSKPGMSARAPIAAAVTTSLLGIAPTSPEIGAVAPAAAFGCGQAMPQLARSLHPAPALPLVPAAPCRDAWRRTPRARHACIRPCVHCNSIELKAYRPKGGGLKPGDRAKSGPFLRLLNIRA